jgi:hypothetical protein
LTDTKTLLSFKKFAFNNEFSFAQGKPGETLGRKVLGAKEER